MDEEEKKEQGGNTSDPYSDQFRELMSSQGLYSSGNYLHVYGEDYNYIPKSSSRSRRGKVKGSITDLIGNVGEVTRYYYGAPPFINDHNSDTKLPKSLEYLKKRCRDLEKELEEYQKGVSMNDVESKGFLEAIKVMKSINHPGVLDLQSVLRSLISIYEGKYRKKF